MTTPTPAPHEGTAFAVTPEDVGTRLDHFLAAHLSHLSRVKVQSAIRSGYATLDGATARPAELLKAGSVILWTEPPPPPPCTTQAEDIPLDILHEDRHLLVINKSAGTVVHPGAGHPHGTIVSALLHHCPELSSAGGPGRPGIVHRLDKETSGCLLVAKNDTVHAALAAQFAQREVKKTYLALVRGVPRRSFGTINGPIGRHPTHRQKMAVLTEGRGREAVTSFRVLRAAHGVALLECHPLTGRTHQIRVHLRHIGHPVLGDSLYGQRGPFHRHLLHAWKLAFRHPITNKNLALEAPPPEQFRSQMPDFQF